MSYTISYFRMILSRCCTPAFPAVVVCGATYHTETRDSATWRHGMPAFPNPHPSVLTVPGRCHSGHIKPEAWVQGHTWAALEGRCVSVLIPTNLLPVLKVAGHLYMAIICSHHLLMWFVPKKNKKIKVIYKV